MARAKKVAAIDDRAVALAEMKAGPSAETRAALSAQLKAEREAAEAAGGSKLEAALAGVNAAVRDGVDVVTALAEANARALSTALTPLAPSGESPSPLQGEGQGAAAGVAEVMPSMVALSRLKLDPANVRSKGKDKVADAQLVADIAAHGVLQNLIGRRDGDDVLVMAGGRRLRALQTLAKAGTIDGDFLVPVQLREGDAGEASLAENLQRLAMNPADECAAFAGLVASGETVADIGRRFGLTERHVSGRLRLAGLAEPVLAALKAGKISLDAAQAFGAVADVMRQAKVWESMKGRFGGYSSPSADEIRRAVASTGTQPTGLIGRFVGRAAYVEAGGSFERDLFSDDDTELWTDDALVQRLALAKLTEAAAALQEKHVFARVLPQVNYGDHAETLAPLNKVDDYYQDWTALAPDVRAKLVVLAVVGRGVVDADGNADAVAEISRQNAWLADGEQLAALDAAEAERDEDASQVFGGGAPRGADVPEPAPAEPEGASLSGRVLDELAMRRRDMLALALMINFDGELGPMTLGWSLVESLGAFLIADQMVRQPGAAERGSALVIAEINDPVSGFDPADALSEALATVEDGFTLVAREWRNGRTVAERFAAFTALEENDQRRWQAFGTVHSLKAFASNFDRRRAPLHDAIGAALIGPSLLGASADWVAKPLWRPTCANFWDRVSKAVCLEFLTDICGAADGAEALAGKLKKPELAALCERLAAGTGDADLVGAFECPADSTIPRRIHAKAVAWLPKVMRFEAEKGSAI